MLRPVFTFGPHTLDVDQRALHRGDERVHLQPKLFELLAYLAANGGRVVPMRELEATVWKDHGGADTEGVIMQAVYSLRRALGQARGEQRPLETLQTYGYRLHCARVKDARTEVERRLWRQYAMHAAEGERTASECAALADELVRAEVSRYGSL